MRNSLKGIDPKHRPWWIAAWLANAGWLYLYMSRFVLGSLAVCSLWGCTHSDLRSAPQSEQSYDSHSSELAADPISECYCLIECLEEDRK